VPPGEIPTHCGRATAPEPEARVVPTLAPPVHRAPVANDSDNDGIPDEEDKCPDTPKGVSVDKKGCVVIQNVVLKGVNFATGSSKLLPAASDTLKTVVSAMKADKKLEVRSRRLHRQRRRRGQEPGPVPAACQVGQGVPGQRRRRGGRLSTKGYGESNPADSNDTKEGRANNRRVAFKVTRS